MEAVLSHNKELQKLYNTLVLFPFIGLVKEHANNFGGGPTATLAKPSCLVGFSNVTPDETRDMLHKYYIHMTFVLILRLKEQGFQNEWQRLSVLVQVITDKSLL